MRKPRLLNKSSRRNPKMSSFVPLCLPVRLSSREFLPPLTNTKPNEMVESLRMTGLLLVILHLLLISRCWFTGCWSMSGCHPAYWGTWGTFALSRLIFRLTWNVVARGWGVEATSCQENAFASNLGLDIDLQVLAHSPHAASFQLKVPDSHQLPFSCSRPRLWGLAFKDPVISL